LIDRKDAPRRSSAENFYAPVRDRYNPELFLSDAAMENRNFRAKEKVAANVQAARDYYSVTT
jgi:hypothetical protein